LSSEINFRSVFSEIIFSAFGNVRSKYISCMHFYFKTHVSINFNCIYYTVWRSSSCLFARLPNRIMTYSWICKLFTRKERCDIVFVNVLSITRHVRCLSDDQRFSTAIIPLITLSYREFRHPTPFYNCRYNTHFIVSQDSGYSMFETGKTESNNENT